MDLASNMNIWSFDVFKIPRFEVLEALDKGFKSKFERAACISVLNKLFTACHVLESKLGLVVLLTNFENYLFWPRNFAQIIFGGAEKILAKLRTLKEPHTDRDSEFLDAGIICSLKLVLFPWTHSADIRGIVTKSSYKNLGLLAYLRSCRIPPLDCDGTLARRIHV